MPLARRTVVENTEEATKKLLREDAKIIATLFFSLVTSSAMAPSEIKKVKKSKKSKTEAAPTLSSFLLAQGDSTDSALNDIFASSVRIFPSSR